MKTPWNSMTRESWGGKLHPKMLQSESLLKVNCKLGGTVFPVFWKY